MQQFLMLRIQLLLKEIMPTMGYSGWLKQMLTRVKSWCSVIEEQQQVFIIFPVQVLCNGFLEHLQRCIPGKILIVWDRLSAHRSKLARDHVGSLNGRIGVEYLPAYAPELNPVEYIWSYLKHHELPNVCAKDLWNLSDGARRSLKRMVSFRHACEISGPIYFFEE